MTKGCNFHLPISASRQDKKNGPQPVVGRVPNNFLQLFFFESGRKEGEVRFIWPPKTGEQKNMKSRFLQGYPWSYIGPPISKVTSYNSSYPCISSIHN